MFALFSSSNSLDSSSGPRAIDLQLLPDAEVLKVWDQSQMMLSMLEEKDIPTHMLSYYTQAIEKELQNRSQIKPNVFFETVRKLHDDEHEARLVSSKKHISFANTILTTNILV